MGTIVLSIKNIETITTIITDYQVIKILVTPIFITAFRVLSTTISPSFITAYNRERGIQVARYRLRGGCQRHSPLVSFSVINRVLRHHHLHDGTVIDLATGLSSHAETSRETGRPTSAFLGAVISELGAVIRNAETGL